MIQDFLSEYNVNGEEDFLINIIIQAYNDLTIVLPKLDLNNSLSKKRFKIALNSKKQAINFLIKKKSNFKIICNILELKSEYILNKIQINLYEAKKDTIFYKKVFAKKRTCVKLHKNNNIVYICNFKNKEQLCFQF